MSYFWRTVAGSFFIYLLLLFYFVNINNMKYKEKVYLNEEQLIRKLKEDGLIIDKIKYVKKYLRNVGYYKLINGYKHPFKDADSNLFRQNTNFNEIACLYKFDFNLRHLLFKYICIIENSIKSNLAEVISNIHYPLFQMFSK